MQHWAQFLVPQLLLDIPHTFQRGLHASVTPCIVALDEFFLIESKDYEKEKLYKLQLILLRQQSTIYLNENENDTTTTCAYPKKHPR